MTVDPCSCKPIYFQLAEALRHGIRTRMFAENAKLPTEGELAAKYGIGRNTVRLAMKKLENERLIYRITGKGTFVAPGQSKSRRLLVVLESMQKYPETSLQGILCGMTMRAQAKDAQLQIVTQEQLPEALALLEFSDVQAGVAFVYNSHDCSDSINKVIAHNLPYIVQNNSAGKFNQIDIDNRKVMRETVDHLYGLGHRDFGIFSISDEVVLHFRERLEAVCERLAELKLKPAVENVIEVPLKTFRESGLAIQDRFLRPGGPTAIICTSDSLAIELLRCANRTGRSVPGEFSITGFDDNPACRLLDPSLTTVRLDYVKLGEMTADYVFRMMNDYVNHRVQVKMDLELIVRESTGPAPHRTI